MPSEFAPQSSFSASPRISTDRDSLYEVAPADPVQQRIQSVHQEIGQALNQSVQGVERMLRQHHRMMQVQELLTESQDELSQNQQQMADSLERVMHSLEKMMLAQEHLVKSMTDVYRHIGSTNAALERMDRVVDYLLKRDGERDRFLEELEALGNDFENNSNFDDLSDNN